MLYEVANVYVYSNFQVVYKLYAVNKERKQTGSWKYRDDVSGAIQVKLDADKNTRDHNGNDHRTRDADNHVFPVNTWRLPAAGVAILFRLMQEIKPSDKTT